jgi:hypothetical protein
MSEAFRLLGCNAKLIERVEVVVDLLGGHAGILGPIP